MGFGWLAMPQACIANRSIDGPAGVLQITLAFCGWAFMLYAVSFEGVFLNSQK